MGGPPGAMTIYPSMTIIGRPQCAARTRSPRDLVESRFGSTNPRPEQLFRHSPPRVGTVDGVE